MIFLSQPQYRNYWLDLARKEKEDKKDKKYASIAALLHALVKNKKKP